MLFVAAHLTLFRLLIRLACPVVRATCPRDFSRGLVLANHTDGVPTCDDLRGPLVAGLAVALAVGLALYPA